MPSRKTAPGGGAKVAPLLECLVELTQERLDRYRKEQGELFEEVACYDIALMHKEGEAVVTAFYEAYNGNYFGKDDEFDRNAFEAALAPFEKYTVLERRPVADANASLGTEEFARLFLEAQEILDGYGTGIYRPNETVARALAGKNSTIGELFLFETYGDEDSSRHEDAYASEGVSLVYTPCLVYRHGGQWLIEAADLVLDQQGVVGVRNHLYAPLPCSATFVKLFRQREIQGKRAFYLDTGEHPAVTLRCSETAYLMLPSLQDPERPIDNKNLSGTRLLIELQALDSDEECAAASMTA